MSNTLNVNTINIKLIIAPINFLLKVLHVACLMQSDAKCWSYHGERLNAAISSRVHKKDYRAAKGAGSL